MGAGGTAECSGTLSLSRTWSFCFPPFFLLTSSLLFLCSSGPVGMQTAPLPCGRQFDFSDEFVPSCLLVIRVGLCFLVSSRHGYVRFSATGWHAGRKIRNNHMLCKRNVDRTHHNGRKVGPPSYWSEDWWMLCVSPETPVPTVGRSHSQPFTSGRRRGGGSRGKPTHFKKWKAR